MSGGGSSGSSSNNSGSNSGTQVTRSEPWSGQQPYLLDVFNRAQTLGNTPEMYFPGQTFAAPSADTLMAQDLQRQRALAGAPVTSAAGDMLTGTLGGNYLSAGNPYFSQMFGQMADQLQPRVAGDFASAGRYGSGAYANALASALANAGGQLAYQNYADERQNQLRGAMLAPGQAQQDYTDIARLAEVGASQESLQQQAINDAMSRFNYAQEEPWQRLARYANMIQGSYGNTTTTSYSGANSGQRQQLGGNLVGGNLFPQDSSGVFSTAMEVAPYVASFFL